MQSGKLFPGQANWTLKFLLENMDAVSLSLKRRRTTWLGISAQFWWCGKEVVACTSAKKYIQVLEQQLKSQTMDFSGKALHISTKKMLTHIFAAITTVWFYSRRVRALSWPAVQTFHHWRHLEHHENEKYNNKKTQDCWAAREVQQPVSSVPKYLYGHVLTF